MLKGVAGVVMEEEEDDEDEAPGEEVGREGSGGEDVPGVEDGGQEEVEQVPDTQAQEQHLGGYGEGRRLGRKV